MTCIQKKNSRRQFITLKRDNSSNSLDCKSVYSSYRLNKNPYFLYLRNKKSSLYFGYRLVKAQRNGTEGKIFVSDSRSYDKTP